MIIAKTSTTTNTFVSASLSYLTNKLAVQNKYLKRELQQNQAPEWFQQKKRINHINLNLQFIVMH